MKTKQDNREIKEHLDKRLTINDYSLEVEIKDDMSKLKNNKWVETIEMKQLKWWQFYLLPISIISFCILKDKPKKCSSKTPSKYVLIKFNPKNYQVKRFIKTNPIVASFKDSDSPIMDSLEYEDVRLNQWYVCVNDSYKIKFNHKVEFDKVEDTWISKYLVKRKTGYRYEFEYKYALMAGVNKAREIGFMITMDDVITKLNKSL